MAKTYYVMNVTDYAECNIILCKVSDNVDNLINALKRFFIEKGYLDDENDEYLDEMFPILKTEGSISLDGIDYDINIFKADFV